MALTNAQKLESLRRRLGERIEPGGSDADTMFTTAEIQDFLDQADGDLDLASFAGWQAKAAELANLVTVTEGNSSRLMSDLHKNAMEQVKFYDPKSSSSKRIRMHRLSRPLNT